MALYAPISALIIIIIVCECIVRLLKVFSRARQGETQIRRRRRRKIEQTSACQWFLCVDQFGRLKPFKFLLLLFYLQNYTRQKLPAHQMLVVHL